MSSAVRRSKKMMFDDEVSEATAAVANAIFDERAALARAAAALESAMRVIDNTANELGHPRAGRQSEEALLVAARQGVEDAAMALGWAAETRRAMDAARERAAAAGTWRRHESPKCAPCWVHIAPFVPPKH